MLKILTYLSLITAVLLDENNIYECGYNPPSDYTDCFNRNINITNTTEKICCYFEPENEEDKNKDTTQPFCKYVPYYEYYYYNKSMTVNGTIYKPQCDVTNNMNIGETCGLDNPKNTSDCTDYSTSDNKCCLYTNNKTNNSQCFWLGKSFSKNIIKYDEKIITCGSEVSFVGFFNYIYVFLLLTTLLIF
jgi:hypothetical protein